MDEFVMVAAACGLPTDLVAVEQVSRAWSNRLFRVTTEAGDFAVKELLNPWQDPHHLDWIGQAAMVEQAAIAAGATSPPVVLNRGGAVVTEYDGRRWRVHRWIQDAQPCPDAPVAAEVAASIGRDLGIAHGLVAQPSRSDCFPQLHSGTARGWQGLVDELHPVAPDWAERAAAVTPLMAQIADRFEQWQALALPTVMSHGDVDPKNVVIDGIGAAWLVDWDVAAPWRRGDELARTAVSFAGDDPALARMLIAAYGDRSELPLIDQHSMTPDLVLGVDWIDLCLRRAGGLSPCEPHRRAEAEQMAVSELDSLAAAVERAGSFPDWLGR